MKRWYEQSVGLHLTRAARMHRARAHAILRDLNLHPGQENVLQVLLGQDGQPMSRIAQALKVKPPTLTKMVARMAAQGLVRRVASDSDGRSANVFMTDKGHSCAIELKNRWKILEQETCCLLPDKDKKKLVRLLSAVEQALDGSSQPLPFPGLAAPEAVPEAGAEDPTAAEPA